jgi:nucleoside-diphosphate-sugar epimerase
LSTTLLVTGSEGLIGTALCAALRAAGHTVRGLDLRATTPEDVRNPGDLSRAMHGCQMVVHLAAVSRVIDGERDPDGCWATNVVGTRNVLDAADGRRVLFASSREVYGEQDRLPVHETDALKPMNVYGRAKVAAEEMVLARAGAVVRLSNVYGVAMDHADRVVPAFARAAAEGGTLRVDGRNHTFDFTHLADTVGGLLAMIGALEAGRSLPPIHLVTGRATTLGQLAELAVSLSGSGATIREAAPRDYDVSQFVGDPSLAAELLDWTANTSIETGLQGLINAFGASSSTP